MPKLVLLSGTKVAAKFPLTAEKTILGRENDNDIVLEGSSVSRTHSQVIREGTVHFIEDLGSRNGILVNGIRVGRQKLQDGDEITIGDYTFLFEEDVFTEDKGETLVSSFSDIEPQKRSLGKSPRGEDPLIVPVEFTSVVEEEPDEDLPQRTIPEYSSEQGDATIVENVNMMGAIEQLPAKVLILLNNKMINEHIINTDIVTIGRDLGNILQLDHETVSAFHSQIVREGRRYKLVDLESKAGTTIRGMKINQSSLSNGDEIGVGAYTLIFRDVREMVTAPASSGSEQADRAMPVIEDDDRTIVQSDFQANPLAMVQHPKLVMLEGPNAGQEYLLNKPEIKIGRDSTNEIVIKDESISRLHAIVRVSSEKVTIADQSSLNGIEINGELLTEANLKKGTQIHLGTVVLRYIERGEVYSIDNLERTGVSEKKTSEVQTSERPEKKAKVPALRIALIGGIALLSIFLVLSFVFKTTPPPPTITSLPAHPSSGDGSGTTAEPTKKPLSEISIYQLITKGKDDLDYHRWEDAIAQFSKILDLKPDHEEARILREQAQTELKNYETLELGKRRFAAQEDEDALRILTQIPASSVYSSPAKDQMTLIRKALISLYLTTGNQLKDQKNYEKAIAEYEKALQIDPKEPQVLTRKRECEKLLGVKPPITKETQKSPLTASSDSGTNKKSALSILQDGLNSYLNGDCTAALQEFQKVLKQGLPDSDPSVQKALHYISVVSRIKDYFESGQKAFSAGTIDRASEDWKNVIELEKDLPKSRNSAFFNKIAPPMAEKLFEKGTAIFNARKESLQLSEAYSLFERVLQFNPNHGGAKDGIQQIDEIASSVYRDGYVREESDVNYALEKWKKVLQIVPSSNEYYQKAEKMIQKHQK